MSTACGRPQGGGQKADFFVDVINGWPLCVAQHQNQIPMAQLVSVLALIQVFTVIGSKPNH